MSLGTAWNIIPCSVLELVQLLVLILLFPVSAEKGKSSQAVLPAEFLGKLFPVILELSDPRHFALCLLLCS